MVVVTLKKTLIMEKQSTTCFFTILEEVVDSKTQKYLKFWQQKNLKNSNIFLMFINCCNKGGFGTCIHWFHK
jgi:hypothetical protein